MKEKAPARRLNRVMSLFAGFVISGLVLSFSQAAAANPALEENSLWSAVGYGLTAKKSGESGTLQRLVAHTGNVVVDIDLSKLEGGDRSQGSLRFAVGSDTMFSVLVFNNELRGPQPSTLSLQLQGGSALSGQFGSSLRNLVLEAPEAGSGYDLVIRDGKTGFTYFYVEGQEYNFDPMGNTFSIDGGRLTVTGEYASAMAGRITAGTVVGTLSAATIMRPVEIKEIFNGEIQSEVMPANGLGEAGTVPGPDVIVGDLSGLAQFGSQSGTQVGLAVGTDSCNAGTVNLNWFQNPNNDHPVIPQNLYRMSGGADGTERFEQIGQSSLKHAFTALTNNICGFGCNGVGGSQLGSGCSDPYSAGLNAGQTGLGSRAWVNPFTGFYPRNDSATPNNVHSGHSHTGTSHRILTEVNDLNTTLNPGAQYFAEAQYVTPHEYQWCVQNPTQCNMFNNVSYRKYNVSGTVSPFSFSPAASTVRQKVAVEAWPGATVVQFRAAADDGIGYIAYKVTARPNGMYHYEYAIYNQNIDRAIASFGIPIGAGVTISNTGFHAPPQHPGWANDGTASSAGFSSTPWSVVDTGNVLTWTSEEFGVNPNANAVRWGTTYNIRFDSNRPPKAALARIGFLKTGSPVNIQVEVPSGLCQRSPQATRC